MQGKLILVKTLFVVIRPTFRNEVSVSTYAFVLESTLHSLRNWELTHFMTKC